MRFGFLAKLAAIFLTVILLSAALARIGWLVHERQQHQRHAIHSVQQSFAGAQTLVGPALRRTCVEEWPQEVGEGKHRRIETQRREFTLGAVPAALTVESSSQTDLRYRGLFKVNGYAAKVKLQARWADLMPLTPVHSVAGSRLECKETMVWLATTDTRGLRGATITGPGGQALKVFPGSPSPVYTQGLRALLPGFETLSPAVPAGPLELSIELDLVGTAQLGLVPAADQTVWKHRSDWPHPSFGGRFLPNQREVGERGFEATWAVSALASAAGADVLRGVALCGATASTQVAGYADGEAFAEPVARPPRGGHAAGAAEAPGCLDTFGVAFIDPVNPYTLSDRAIKYGLLFVLLTFTAVALAEGLAAGGVRRVHPVQYALVGLTLSLFFLLLLSLSEHLSFGVAYASASVACVVLLGFYARHMLGRWRDGLVFGAGIALLYGLLYLLLLREQTALVLGSVGLFAALALVMLLTRRVDWYRLAPFGAAPAAEAA
jgi:inner membrane protein